MGARLRAIDQDKYRPVQVLLQARHREQARSHKSQAALRVGCAVRTDEAEGGAHSSPYNHEPMALRDLSGSTKRPFRRVSGIVA